MRKLFIIDLQKQFKDTCGSYERIVNDVINLKPNYDKVYATVFTQGKNPNYVQKLNWTGCSDSTEKDLEFDLNGVQVIVKDGYGIPDIRRYIESQDEIDVIGCDTDACVLAVCF